MTEFRDPEKHGRISDSEGDGVPIEQREDTRERSSTTEKRNSELSHVSHSSRGSHNSDETDDGDAIEPIQTPGESGSIFQEITHIRTTTSIGSFASRPPDFEVVFEDDDGENPRYWSLAYRSWVIFSVSFTTWTVVLYSTSYTASIPGLMVEFGVASTPVATLGVTTYLLGLATGSLIVAPASELYGRRWVYIICMIAFTLLVIPCALATSLAEIIVVRFFGALFGSAMVSNSAGTVTDISTDEYRALVLSLWSIAPLNGPASGPLIGGFVYQYLGWRWDNWLVLILAGVGTLCVIFTAETYTPTILQAKAARMRKQTDDERWWCRYDEKVSRLALIKLNLIRPLVLLVSEPILWFFNLWISLIYGILYLCFVAYPIVFTQHRGWGPGQSGLAFLGIGIGTLLSIFSEPLWRKIINSGPKDPVTGKTAPEAIARVMIVGAIAVPVGQLGFSWTCLPATIHWAAPIAFGIPFGLGNSLSFIYGSSYLAGAYGIYAASALAGNAVTRSLFGGTLPLAGPALYERLTPQWAGTFLGLLEVLLVPIPFIFSRYGEGIRAKSPIIRQMREDQAKNERRAERAQRRKDKQQQQSGSSDKTAVGEKKGVNEVDKDVEKGDADLG